LKLFFVPAPLVETKEWLKFLQFCGQSAIIEQDDDESENVYIAHQIFEDVCKFESTTNGDLVLKPHSRKLYSYDGAFWIPSYRIEEIVTQHGYKIAQRILSKTMTDLRMKRKGTGKIRIGSTGNPTRSWGFDPLEIDAFKNHQTTQNIQTVNIPIFDCDSIHENAENQKNNGDVEGKKCPT
jgi:hypothetical protein